MVKKNSMNEIMDIKSKIIGILKKNNVVKAGIFGSYARGEQNKNSDVDILVEISDKKMSLFGFVRMKIELEEKLGKKVDLVEYNIVKQRIRKSVLDSEVRLI